VPVSGTRLASLVDGEATTSWTLTSIPSGLAIDRMPFGPFTPTRSAWMLNSTPLATAIGFLATRDMFSAPLGHEAQDLTADALLARLGVGHDALGGGNDRDAEAAEDLGLRVLAAVLAQAGTRDAVQADRKSVV